LTDPILLTQREADTLIAVEKHRANDDSFGIPLNGEKWTADLVSVDGRERFLLDVGRGRIAVKAKFQNRARQIVVLVRVDTRGRHKNPDGVVVPAPHIHVYREGYGDQWAEPLPKDHFGDPTDFSLTLREFMRYCSITKPPVLQGTLEL
jgi:uncharacterized protein DUF6978